MFGFGRDPEKTQSEVAAAVARERGYGGQSMVAPLLRVVVQPPAEPVTADDFRRFNYPNPVDHARTVAEHDAFCQLLESQGVEVVRQSAAEPGNLDAIFVFDPSIVTDEGVILCRPGKEVRRPEVELAAALYRKLEIPVIGTIEEPGILEGGDVFWIDANTLAVGEGFRTNRAGIDQLQIYLQPFAIDLIRVPLPYWRGPGECLHLLSLISPVAERTAVAFRPLIPVTFVHLLSELGWQWIDVPEEEFASQGTNVLALAPGKVVMLNRNPVTQRRLEEAGYEVHLVTGDHMSHNRGGGPTCLTRPLLRDVSALVPLSDGD
jgi:N-dimethylarginine dimethylaminohydrolase